MHKVKVFDFNFLLPFPTKDVWDLIANDYGNVANYANGLASSSGLGDIQNGKEGCQRICRLNETGSKYLIEKMEDVNAKSWTFTNVITEVKGLPIVPNLSKVIFALAPDANNCKTSMEIFFRTKPAFLARFLRGSSKKQMGDLMIGIEHHLKTGEIVKANNFKPLTKRYTLTSIN
ncbi:MAG: hypothetical protein ACI93R_001150 [Flavobacteriales bacterium]|jgi:hypothetical protein